MEIVSLVGRENHHWKDFGLGSLVKCNSKLAPKPVGVDGDPWSNSRYGGTLFTSQWSLTSYHYPTVKVSKPTIGREMSRSPLPYAAERLSIGITNLHCGVVDKEDSIAESYDIFGRSSSSPSDETYDDSAVTNKSRAMKTLRIRAYQPTSLIGNDLQG